jgi:drug/metabolite transporter (DMT)-like permease
MDPIVFTAVLFAAAMHAGWNAIIKLNLEPLKAITLISIAYFFLVGPFAPFIRFPVAEAWPYLIASLVIHILYYYALGEAYRTGDLGHVYPIARGTAPLMTAIGAHFIIGEDLGFRGVAGIFMLTSGILLLSLKGGRKGATFDKRAIGFALLCASSISAYTLVDGVGARSDPDPLPYIAWLMILDGLMMLVFGLLRWGVDILRLPARTWALVMAGGVMSLASYAIALWAMTRAPIALVAALRETSVLFAAVIGVVFLREPILAPRIVAAGLVLIGVVLLRLR